MTTTEHHAANETPRFIATCPKGLEHLLARELASLGASDVTESVAACYFFADVAIAYQVCLWTRLANRVALLLARDRINSDEELYTLLSSIHWSAHFAAEKTISIDFNGTSKFIRDARYGALRVKDAISDHFVARGENRPVVDNEAANIVVYVRLFKGRLSIGLDMVGESLHKRGYRAGGGAAPLKENLAAALLYQCDWPAMASQGNRFVDPMCGSGTLLIEAALIAANIPPTFLRLRGFTGRAQWSLAHMLSFDQTAWSQATTDAQTALEDSAQQHNCLIEGFDIDPRSIANCRDNLRLAGLDEWVQLKQCDIADLKLSPSQQQGLLLVNPPYGERLGDIEALQPVYRQLGEMMKRDCLHWQAAILTGNRDLGWQTGLRSWRQHRFYNGAIECQLQRYKIAPENFARDNVQRGKAVVANEDLNEQAQMLANRLRKNRKRLKSWLDQNPGQCYRLYDADLPEYAVAIDCYWVTETIAETDKPHYYASTQGKRSASGSEFTAARAPGKRHALDSEQLFVHIQEYAPPAKVDANVARKRVKDAMAAVSAVFECPLARIVIKRRERQRGSKQYEKLDASASDLVINEQGHKLKINLGRYLDTGVFLDHRAVRRLIASDARGQRFLNLYSYTSSATVYAAMAGAASSVSVDMSNSYLEWSQHNFELNEIDSRQHRLVRADCEQWLARAQDTFDLILLDPPSFSNSKRMDGTLDISRDQLKLLDLAMKRLAAGGKLYFSNNKRGFKLAQEITERYAVIEITEQTLDPDFRRGRPAHQCWVIQHK